MTDIGSDVVVVHDTDTAVCSSWLRYKIIHSSTLHFIIQLELSSHNSQLNSPFYLPANSSAMFIRISATFCALVAFGATLATAGE